MMRTILFAVAFGGGCAALGCGSKGDSVDEPPAAPGPRPAPNPNRPAGNPDDPVNGADDPAPNPNDPATNPNAPGRSTTGTGNGVGGKGGKDEHPPGGGSCAQTCASLTECAEACATFCATSPPVCASELKKARDCAVRAGAITCDGPDDINVAEGTCDTEGAAYLACIRASQNGS